MRTRLFVALLAPALLVTATPKAAAQTSLQVPLQFDFINPGAKNLGLGGAFAGLADDATATFANPGGLTQLGASEVSAELRGFALRTPFLQGGRLSGPVTNQGFDTVQGPSFGRSDSSAAGLGFVAGAYVAPSRRWVVAGYRHELIRIDQAFQSLGVFQKSPDELTSRRQSPQSLDREMTVTTYGGSVAYAVRRAVSIGASLAVHDFSFATLARRFDTDGFLGGPRYDIEFGRSTQAGDDVAVTPTVGLMIGEGVPDASAPLRRRVKVGLVYRHGPSFQYTTVDGGDPAREQRFRVPHTLAAGASLRLSPQFVLSAEVTHVRYSRIREDYVVDQARASGREADFTIEDGTELHVGGQYAMPGRRLIPRLRAGLWIDPDHTVQFRPSRAGPDVFGRLFDEAMTASTSQGATQVHGAAGIGLTLHRRFELNAGADISRDQVRVSTSLIVR